MSETLSEILKFLALVVGAMMVLAWCSGCMFGMLWISNQVPLDGMLERALNLVAAFGGLAFALLVLAKVTGSRL